MWSDIFDMLFIFMLLLLFLFIVISKIKPISPCQPRQLDVSTYTHYINIHIQPFIWLDSDPTLKEINQHYEYVMYNYMDESKSLCYKILYENELTTISDEHFRYVIDYIGLLFWVGMFKKNETKEKEALDLINKIETFFTFDKILSEHPIAATMIERYFSKHL